MKIIFRALLAIMVFTIFPLSAEFIKITSNSQFNSLINNNKAIVIKFTADYCPPCKLTKKPFKEITQEDEFKNITFTEIDIQSSIGESLSTKYRILGVPAFVFIQNGKEIEKIVGLNRPAQFKEDFKTKIREIFAKTPKKEEPLIDDDTITVEIEKEEEILAPAPIEEQKTEAPQKSPGMLYQLLLSIQALFIFVFDKIKEAISYIVNLIKGIFSK